MVTRELVKAEIDKVQDRYLEVIYRIIKALVSPPELDATSQRATSSWNQFIEETYGSLADDPIERGEQGQYEIREAIA
jgi:hypothetical protein